jgi:hypothetical protein
VPQWIKDIAKAFSGGALAGIAAATTALVGDGKIDTLEWLAVAAAIIYGGYGVWQTPDSMSPMRKALKNAK